MNLLIINHYAGAPNYGMEYRPYYMAKEWMSLGHSVTIVASSESHVRIKPVVVNKGYLEEVIDGIRYIWLKTPNYSGNGPRRFINMLVFVFSIYKYRKRILDNFLPDCVIASSTYPLDIFPAKNICNLVKAKLVFEVHDLWPLSPMELGGMSKYHPFIMIMQIAENYAYKNSNLIVSMLPNAKGHMEEHGMTSDKYVYIPNGVKVSEWKNSKEKLPYLYQEKLNNAKDNNTLIVGYAGAHGIANALGSLIDAAELLKNENVLFVLIGDGPEKINLLKLAEQKGLNNIIFLPPVKKSVIPCLLKEIDILYIGLQKQPLFRFGVSPNKLMDYMMAAKPIIQAIESGNDIVSDAECGISIKAEDSHSLAKAIMAMSNLTESEREKMGQNGQKYVLRHHDYKILAKRFLEKV